MEGENIILITQRVIINEIGDKRFDDLDQRYVHYVSQMGFSPIPVPNNPIIISKFLQNFTQNISGLLLTGGNDLAKYGGKAAERDETEKILIHYCMQENIPILGFCRGLQIIAVTQADASLAKTEGHVATRHCVKGPWNKEVNSYHNWAIKTINNSDYEVLAYSEDNNIESIKHHSKPILGVMWHPERETQIDQYEQNLYKCFFDTGKFDL